MKSCFFFCIVVASTIASGLCSSVVAAPKMQRGAGQPYEIVDSQVWDIADPRSKRSYQVFVALPPSYDEQPQRRYPVLYVTDADYAFPLLKQIGRRLNGGGPRIEEFILVGLSYAKGDNGMDSRRRDYTPTAAGSAGVPATVVHGEGVRYQQYLQQQVLPFIAKQYRTDEQRRLFLGHSYGGLLGMQILLTEPQLFQGYILGSPSLWYDQQVMFKREQARAVNAKDLPAKVYFYVGEYEDMRAGDPRFATRYNMVTDTQNMVAALKSRRYPSLQLQLEVFNDEDHLSVAPRGFTHGLRYLLGIAK